MCTFILGLIVKEITKLVANMFMRIAHNIMGTKETPE
jgi:hypothetical protein